MGRMNQSARQPGTAIDLRIEELVLHGFDPHQRRCIGAAVETELARLLGASDAAEALGGATSLARLDGGRIDASPDATPESTGAAIARAVYGSLTR